MSNGDIETDESLTKGAIRKVKEEKSIVSTPQLMAIVKWRNKTVGSRELTGLFTTKTSFQPTIMEDNDFFGYQKISFV